MDVSALVACASLQVLNLSRCYLLADLSALAACASLQTLNLLRCYAVADVSALAGCASLKTLNLAFCDQLTDVLALAGCASLQTLNLAGCDQLMAVSGLAGYASLQTLNLSCCYAMADMSALDIGQLRRLHRYGARASRQRVQVLGQDRRMLASFVQWYRRSILTKYDRAFVTDVGFACPRLGRGGRDEVRWVGWGGLG